MLDLASDATLSLAFSLACKRPPVFRARLKALPSNAAGAAIAAILTDKRGRIVSVGFNSAKTNSRSETSGTSAEGFASAF